MKSLRSKIFIFICLLLIFPAVPLSVFIMQLLDKSYQIGVNERVESALDGALEISSDFYQMHRKQLENWLEELQTKNILDDQKVRSEMKELNPLAEYRFRSLTDISAELVSDNAFQKFLNEKNKNSKKVIWPDPEHTRLFALVSLTGGTILEIEYPLPVSFQQAAKSIQDVNQIYKTLDYVQSDVRRSFLFTFLSIYLLGVILALVISYFISRKITRPIERLVIASNEIGKGNLLYQVPVKGNDEFAVLGSAFNNMVIDLAKNQRRIIELEKMATWQELARKLAHEIKNPLTPIQLMAQQMRDKYNGNDEHYKKLLMDCSTIIEDEVGSLQHLVREFSDFARLPEFKLLRQDILYLFDSIQKLYSHENLKISLPDKSINIDFDFDYLKRVFINLIDNAIAATEGDKPIEINLKVIQNKEIQIDISDLGEGIEADNLDKIFEPYFSTKSDGVGLGLAIVKKVIDEHGGRISVQSEPGQGTTFSIQLPQKLK